MKAMKLGLVIMAAALLTIGLSGMAYAFHSGGVAECEGCHSMHSPKAGGLFLMVGTDQSSTCLTCHEHAGDVGPSSYHISSAPADMPTGVPPKQRTPGGDFGWLKKTYDATSGTNTYHEDGATHGHNIVAVDNGYSADGTNTTAPGGTFPSAQLACNSCHDPHGQYRRLPSGTIAKTGAPIKASGSYNAAANEPTATEAVGVYRLLAGAGYTKGGVTFNGVPAAKVPSTYNQTEATNQVRVAYGVATANGHETWSNWCATCHPGMHSTGNYVHPVDTALSGTVINNYNSYVKSGDMTGAQATAFLSLVPFATNSGNYTTLAGLASNTNTQLGGPASGDQVTCMSCHRAHASGFMEALRFDNGYEFFVIGGNYVGSNNALVTGSRAALQHRGRLNAEWQAAYYDRPATPTFATYQRVLCNKCHAKD
jgi:predicted CXXCH cytochrome family protein